MFLFLKHSQVSDAVYRFEAIKAREDNNLGNHPY